MTPWKFAVAAVALFAALPVAAHPKLVSSVPAAGAAVDKGGVVTLRFSEKLVPSFTGATLAMTGMGGKAHAPMAMATKPSFGADGKTLILTPTTPLVAGDYKLDWHAVGGDTHRVTGSFSFKVR